MTFEEWKRDLAGELAAMFGWHGYEGVDYIIKTGDVCWREMFDDGLTPKEAAIEEVQAAAEST